MKIHIIIGQRSESYAGEYAPEVIHVIDDAAHSDNPDWLRDRLKEAKADTSYAAAEIFTVDLGAGAAAAIRERLLGTMTLKGTLQAEA